MIQILDNMDFNHTKSQEFRISQSDPTDYTDSNFNSLSGKMTCSKNDVYLLRDYNTGYQALLREDKQEILNNVKFSALDEEFKLNTYYYLHGYQGTGQTNVLQTNTSDIYACNSNFYYVFNLQGYWDGREENNDYNYDFIGGTYNTIEFRLESSDDRTNWDLEKAIVFTCGATRFDFANVFMIKPVGHRYYRVFFHHELGHDFKPIDEYEGFFFNIVGTRKPRLSWKYRFVIPSSAYQSGNTFVYELPSAISKLPFTGIYALHAFLGTEEADMSFAPVNCMTAQSLAVSANNSSYTNIDVSPTYGDTGPVPTGVMKPNSLQGSIYYFTNTDKLYLKATLPNGFYKKVTGGYVDLHFAGDILSPALID